MKMFVVVGMLSLAVSASADQYSPPKLDGDPVEVVKKLYLDLLKFKDKAEFRELGFAVTSPYNEWLKVVESIKDKDECIQALAPLGVVPGELTMLGLEYVGSRGRETNYSKFIRREFDSAFKISAPDPWAQASSSTASASDAVGESNRVEHETAESQTPEDWSYEITDTSRVPGVKCGIDVRLSRKVTADELRALALKLRKQERGNYQRVFITYLLPGMTPGAGAWATSHFNPDLEVKILGLTIEEEKKVIAESQPVGEVVGRWFDQFIGCTVTIREDNGVLVLERKFKDGSVGKFEVIETTQRGRRRFERESGSAAGEYYLINSEGDLESHDRQGIIDTARALH